MHYDYSSKEECTVIKKNKHQLPLDYNEYNKGRLTGCQRPITACNVLVYYTSNYSSIMRLD